MLPLFFEWLRIKKLRQNKASRPHSINHPVHVGALQEFRDIKFLDFISKNVERVGGLI